MHKIKDTSLFNNLYLRKENVSQLYLVQLKTFPVSQKIWNQGFEQLKFEAFCWLLHDFSYPALVLELWSDILFCKRVPILCDLHDMLAGSVHIEAL